MTARQRGQPLIFLAMVLTLWIGARIFVWTGASSQPRTVALVGTAPPEMRSRSRPVVTPENPSIAVTGVAISSSPLADHPLARHPLRPMIVPSRAATGFVQTPGERPAASSPAAAAGEAVQERPAFMAIPAQPPGSIASTPPAPPSRAGERRWSGDAWALVRSGGGTIGAGPAAGTYGGNQAGGVLRYRLAPGNPHRPTAYLRATAALNGSGEREAALGLSAQPFAAIPVVLAAEGRVGKFAGRVLIRPAVMAVTELPPVRLPGNTRAEFYGQAGYVGGTSATPFADGQLRIDRRVVEAGGIELRAGGGAWGGAQRGAARLDVGPSATLGISQNAASARIGVDWRFRIAGAAQPASGPALTVSAGF